MSIDIITTAEWINDLEIFLDKVRPEEHIREKLDIAYKIVDQSIIIHEIRPRFDNPNEKIEPEIAKATFVKSKKYWKVFWQRADLKWHRYDPVPTVSQLSDFLKIVREDKYHCFWG